MQYAAMCTKEILKQLKTDNGVLQIYDDFLHGSDYLEAAADGQIKPGDPVLMFSLDGAQLYASKTSDCWICIWVIFNHHPDVHYRKICILPATVIPGPNKPKITDSFLFATFHHLAAIQKEGLRIWDASHNTLYTAHPFLALGTADSPSMVYLNGLVGHQGKFGC
jgi:hypothetical protein